MDGGRRLGRPEEELFLRQPAHEPATPTVGPLRINKAGATAASPPPGANIASTQNKGMYRSPPTQLFPLPHSSPIPAPSAPLGPLPYPDDRLRQQAAAGRHVHTPLSEAGASPRNGTPEQGQRRRSSATQPSGSPRVRFEANDPNRPTVSGYGYALPGQDGRPTSPQLFGTPGRQANAPKPLPDSPAPEIPEKEGLFQRAPQQPAVPQPTAEPAPRPAQDDTNPFPDYHQQYWPPPITTSVKSSTANLRIPNPSGVNRLSSTASTSTTRAQRGSPPPPETPAVEQLGGGIEARYAAAGIAGTATLNNLQAQSAAAVQRANQSGIQTGVGVSSPPQLAQQQPPQRPWTPTEQPGTQPHGPPAVYQGASAVAPARFSPPVSASRQNPAQAQAPQHARASGDHALEQDFQRMNMNEEPPPSYSSVQQGISGSTTGRGYLDEKANAATDTLLPNTLMGAALMAEAHNQMHPAFANDPRPQPGPSEQPRPVGLTPIHVHPSVSPGPGAGPASPPPLPEGWIAHLDPSSGQYYYIHLPTQSTQWEFPKGPTPLNLNEPMSPTGTFVNPLASPGLSTFSGKQPLSPGFPVTQHADYRRSSLSMAAIASPTAAGFTGPPPSAGVEMYKIAPTNGVYFGPYLRYTNMDIERGTWLGSILLITDVPQPPTIHIHQSIDLSPNRK